MKQALIILAAFLHLAPSISSGQDFEVVGEVSGKVESYVAAGTKFDTTGLVVKNLTNKTITIKFLSKNERFELWHSPDMNHGTTSTTIPANTAKALTLRIKPYISGGLVRDKITIRTDSTIKTIVYDEYVESNLLANDGIAIYTGDTPTVDSITIFAINGTSKPINLYKVPSGTQIMDFTKREDTIKIIQVLPMPYVILPGEKLPVSKVYVWTSAPQLNYSSAWSYAANTQTDQVLGIDILSDIPIDTNLLKPCLSVTESSGFDTAILYGGSITKTLSFRSNRYDTLIVNSISFIGADAPLFSSLTTLPISIPPLSTGSLQIAFSPSLQSSTVKDRFATSLKILTSCKEFSLEQSAFALHPTADSIATPLFPDKEYVLGMSSSAPSFSQDFHFVNNGLTNTKIISVGLADPSPEFVVTNITPTNTLPFTLLPGEKMTVSVLFTPSQVGKVFFNQLVITTEQGIQSVSYPLQGLRTTASGVHESSEPSVSVSLTPNPASASVTVSVKDAGQIDGATMTDELGKSIFYYNQPQQPEWKWELTPTRIAAGTYFIRINGKTVEGKPFVATKRLVVQ